MVVPPRSAIGGYVGLEIILPLVGHEDVKEVLEALRNKEGVLFAMECMKREK